MPQAIADPDDLERFANTLVQFAADLQSNTAALNSAFQALGESWQDQEQRKFEGEYQELTRVLHDFAGRVEEHVPYLRKKAVHLRDYLQSH
jgi:uncharacterized protein YukE